MKSKIILSLSGLTIAIFCFASVQGNMANSRVESLDSDYHQGQAAISLVIALAFGIPSAATLISEIIGKEKK